MAPDPRPLRLVFMGTAAFAVPSLEALALGRHEIVAVYTQPARPAGRGMEPRLSPVALAAERLSLAISTPASLRPPDAAATLAALDPDLAVVAAYGLILPAKILEVPRHGCINLHGSLLPRWRGAAPIQRALLAGDTESGITIIQMDASLDTGPMLARAPVDIEPDTTSATLHDTLARLAAEMIGPAIEAIAAGRATAVAQPDEGVTYAAKIEKSEGHIDWAAPAAVIERGLRALNPWPGCWTTFDGQRIRVLAGEVTAGKGAPGEILDPGPTIACGGGALRLKLLQRAGGKALPAADFLRGFALPVGARLGLPGAAG